MSYRPSAKIIGGQVVVRGTVAHISVDWTELDGQSFNISTATFSMFDSDGDAVSTGIVDVGATVEAGDFNGETRTRAVLSAAQTDLPQGNYYGIWTLTMLDTQTRIAKERFFVQEVS